MIYEMLSGINPYKVRNKNKFEKLQMILEDEIEMQPMFSEDAISLIQGLLSKKVRRIPQIHKRTCLAQAETWLQRLSRDQRSLLFREHQLVFARKKAS